MIGNFNNLFYSFIECEEHDLNNHITLENYNNCPCCNVVNHPKILGLVEYPIKAERVVGEQSNYIKLPFKDEEVVNVPKEVHMEIVVGVETDIVYQCTNTKCQKIFIVHYESEKEYGQLKNTIVKGVSPFLTSEIVVSDNINEICEKYYEIYRQAYLSEMMGLTEICGMGYRKALEFLVKDYVIYLNKDNSNFSTQELQKKLLGKVISEDISSARIQEITRRAVWLGNDETHYLRKWVEKDVQDLKNIISIVVFEIEMELAYRKTIQEMPNGK